MKKLGNIIFSLFFITIFGALSFFSVNLQADDETNTTESSPDTDIAGFSVRFGGGRGGGPYWYRRNERSRGYSRPYWRNHPRYSRYGYQSYYPRRANPYYYDPYYYYNDRPNVQLYWENR